MSAGIKANNDGSAAIQVGGSDYIEISAAGDVTIPQSQTISGNLVVTGTATIGGQPAGGNYALQTYVAPATWTKPAGLKAIKVTVVGAGGNGGVGASPSPGVGPWLGGGGGGGGAAIDYIPAPSIPGPVAVTAGPGTNSFGAFCSATGGANGGQGLTGAPGAGGPGGAGSGGNLIFDGNRGLPGGNGFLGGGGGAGGNSVFSTNATPNSAPNGPGPAGRNYGGGGAGGTQLVAGTAPGGTGAPGIVIVEEFY